MTASQFLKLLGGIVFSGTRVLIEWWKERDPVKRGHRLRQWSLALFLIELIGAILLTVTFQNAADRGTGWFTWGVLLYAWWRVNEIVYAFYNDALDTKKRSGLLNSERIRMAMRSYFGLAVNFAIACYFAPLPNLFNVNIESFSHALYFSGVTLATLGYGDVYPVRLLSRAFSLYEVFSGILILAVAIATYAGGRDA